MLRGLTTFVSKVRLKGVTEMIFAELKKKEILLLSGVVELVASKTLSTKQV